MIACPWDFLAPDTLDFCEKNLCAWIVEPGNTWSNIFYFFVGAYLWNKSKVERQPLLFWIGTVSIVTGVGSAFFHLSGTYVGGIADNFGMFLGTGLLTGYNARRWFGGPNSIMYSVFAATTSIFIVALLLFPDESRTIYSLGMPCCLIELFLFFRDRKKINYKYYLWMSLFAGVASFFWWADISGTICNPDNHFISGHGLWHFFTAIAFLPMYSFYRQFD